MPHTPVNFSAIEENTVEKNCLGKDPLISISIALCLAVIASVFLLYLYWKHINLKQSVHVSYQHNSEMQENNLRSEKTTDNTVQKELEQRETEYESLIHRKEDDYESLDIKHKEPISGNEDSASAKDFKP